MREHTGRSRALARVAIAAATGGVLLAGCSAGSRSAADTPSGSGSSSAVSPAAGTTATTPSSPGSATSAPPASSASSPVAPATTTGGVPRPDHVVVVIEENHSYGQIIGNASMPYLNGLAANGALFTNAHAVTHPSEPNYIALFSGSPHGVTDDSCPHTFTSPNLTSELLAAGRTFVGYAESLPETGSTVCAAGQYGRKHAPWIDFSNVPKTLSVDFTHFPHDYASLPTVSFVIPNLDNDMHDGTPAQADAWLKDNLDGYVRWAMSHNSLLIVTWDENGGASGNTIPLVVAGQHVTPARYTQRITHYNVLRTLEDFYRLPALGASSSAAPITGVWR